jgi:hypothetical protein
MPGLISRRASTATLEQIYDHGTWLDHGIVENIQQI